MTEPTPEIPLKVTVTSPKPKADKPGVVRASGSTRRHLIGMGAVITGGGLVAAASTGLLVPVAVGVGAVGVAGTAAVIAYKRSTARRRSVGRGRGAGGRFGTRGRTSRGTPTTAGGRRHRLSMGVGAGQGRARRQRNGSLPGQSAGHRKGVAGWSAGRRGVDRHALRAHGAVGHVSAQRTAAGRVADRAAAPVKRAVGTRRQLSGSGSTAVGHGRQPAGSVGSRRHRKSLTRRMWDYTTPVSFASTGIRDRADGKTMMDSAAEPVYDGPPGPGVTQAWNTVAGKVGDHVRMGWASPWARAWGIPFQGLFTKKTEPDVRSPDMTPPGGDGVGSTDTVPADKKPVSWTTTPATTGGTMFGFDAAVKRLATWSADDPDQMRATLKTFPDELEELAAGIRAMATALEEDHPFGQSVPDAYHEVANMVSAAASMAGIAPSAFERENEKDLDRHDAPRRGEKKWNV